LGVTSDQDGVIKVVTAALGDDTAAVQLPGILVSFNGNRDGLLGQGSVHLFEVLGGDALGASVDIQSKSLLVLAVSTFTIVGVDLLEFNTVGSSVSHSN